MLTSPITLTINATPFTLNRIEEDKKSSLYSTDDGTHTLKVSHQASKKRMRRMARVDKIVLATDPLTAESAYQTAGVYVVIDEPEFGFNDADLEDLVEGLKAFLTSANILAICASRH